VTKSAEERPSAMTFVRTDDDTGIAMTGTQSRALKVLDRVCWQKDEADHGVVMETNWAGVTIKWDGRGEQTILHNDTGRLTGS
jgi:hypothetical protein